VKLPLAERKARLAELLAGTPEAVSRTVVRERPDNRSKGVPCATPCRYQFRHFLCG
jgi:hypothetical protein